MILKVEQMGKAALLAGGLLFSQIGSAQTNALNMEKPALLRHGIEQYQQGHYLLAAQSFDDFLRTVDLPAQNKAALVTDAHREQAAFYKVLSEINLGNPEHIRQAQAYVAAQGNAAFKQRAAFELAKHFFRAIDHEQTIYYYELAGVDNLTNAEVADAKFEMAYSYFLNQDFAKAKNLMAAIKDMPGHKYYNASNYYYGLLSYNDGFYDEALTSFQRVKHVPEYQDILPYYETEIYYFKGDYDKVLENAHQYLGKEKKLYYDKEMHLITAQTLFEQKKYAEALPYFRHFYNNSERVRKEVLYEYGYTFYQLGQYSEAIDKFQQLSNQQDSLGQGAMYLLGDCYLKTNDKKGARNAFGLCSEMDFNAGQKEAASFLYNKLSYELGFESLATRGFGTFIKEYPASRFNGEARSLLSSLLIKSSNFAEAYTLLSESPNLDGSAKRIFQQAAVGRGLQLMQNKDYEEAKAAFDASLQYPENTAMEAVAYFWKGEIAYQQNQFQESAQYTKAFLSKVKGIEAATAAISSKANVQNANVNLGYAGLKSSNFSEAKAAFNEAQTAGGTTANESIIRQADAAFMQKEYEEALRLYERSITANSGDPDYARYQKALILGLQDKDVEKIEILKTLSNKNNSALRWDAALELASAYLDQDKNKEAIALLEKVQSGNATALQKSKAAYQIAYAYQDAGQNQKAINAYQQFIKQNPTASERAAAIAALKTLYVAEGNPEVYAKFVRAENLQESDPNSLEETYYDAADNEFSAGRYEKAVALFDKYLQEYPNGSQVAKSLYYRAESYTQLKKDEKALADYDALLAKGWSEFAEDAALKAADISIKDGNLAAAKRYYDLLKSHNASPSATQHAGMMKLAFAEKDYAGTEQWADQVLADSEAEALLKAEAQLYKAKSLQLRQSDASALSLYRNLDKSNQGAISAEARYRIAEILFAQKNNAEAEKAASYAAQASGGEEYWVIKNYLLLADILADNKDYFNAKATLQSIVSNASDAALVQEAKTKLEKIKTLEKAKSKLAD